MVLHGHLSGLVSTTDLVKSSQDMASLVVCTRKKFLVGGADFCEWRHKWKTLRPPWPSSPGPGFKALDGNISLKFLLETRLQSDFFDTLDDLLGFRVQKLWSKVNKYLTKWLIKKLINLFILDYNFWTRNARKSIKGSKDSDSSLVANENFREILWPSSWALGQVIWANMAPKLLHLWRHSQKSATPKQKIFCRLDDWPIHLSPWTARAQSAEELWCW